MSGTKVVKTTCGMCSWDCGLSVQVKEDRVIKVEGRPDHPINRLCTKAEGMVEWLYSDERITHPLRKVNGRWERIPWEDALAIIIGKLEEHKRNFGPESVVVFVGQSGIGDAITWARRFCDVYGTPNYTSGSSHCFFARVLGSALTSGYGYPIPDYQGTRCIVIWGCDPEQSREFEMAVLNSSVENGAKLIVVNPRKIPLAKRADIHAQLRPGTDSALALGLLNVIISEQLYDEQFVKQWTVGFDDLVEQVRKYPPEEVEKITWVSADTIRQFARTYATSKPACISPGISLEHCTNGIQAIRAITTLIAITGNHDVPGGNKPIEPLPRTSVRVRQRVTAKPFNDKYPLFMAPLGGEVPVHPLPEAILTEKPYPIKALIVQAGNPVTQWPNASKTIDAFKKLDLLVCMDLFMTETANLAHIFLPACTFLERTEIRPLYQAYLPLLALRVPVIEPIGESWPDWKFWFELGKRMGYEGYFPWEDIEQATNYCLEPSGITVRALKLNPPGLFWADKDLVKRYRERGFPTPSGKVEIYSENMGKLGYDPLPTYHEPVESPVSQPELAKEYPFMLIAGTRIDVYTHSRYRMVPSLRKRHPEPLMEINAENAKKLNISEGDIVIVESPRGGIKIRAQLTDDILPGVVHVDYGWGGEANVNCLVDEAALDPISGFPGFKSALCRVRKAEK